MRRLETSGFTLLECLIAFTLIACVCSVSLIGLREYRNKTYETHLQRQLIHLLQTALHEARVRHQDIALCLGRDQTCQKSPRNTAYLFIKDSGEQHAPLKIIREEPLKMLDGEFFFRVFPWHYPTIVFKAEPADFHHNGSIWYCAHGKRYASFAILVNQLGHIKNAAKDAKGMVRDAHGKVLACSK